jgi:hypothetical protein
MSAAPAHTQPISFAWTRAARRRAWALLVVLAVAFAALGHFAHAHDADASPAAYKACSYCKTSDRAGAPPPVPSLLVAAVALVVALPLPGRAAPAPGRNARTPCSPRAPPRLRP